MTPSSAAPSIPARNALIAGVPQSARPAPRMPANVPGLLASTIGHAALLSDTPSKWASTIDMLKQNGVDPQGYEDFEKGRPAAMAAAGTQAPQDDED
ncbi:MAG: hypothetical protein ACLPX9_15125 [Rhodomicrobium sp.]